MIINDVCVRVTAKLLIEDLKDFFVEATSLKYPNLHERLQGTMCGPRG